MKRLDNKDTTTIGIIYGLILLSLVLIFSKTVSSLLFSMDLTVFSFFNTHSLLVPLMKIITFFGDWKVLLLFTLGLFPLIYHKDKNYYKILAISIIFTQGLVFILKELFKKARPPLSFIKETGYSFPSGHTTTSLVFYLLLAFFINRNYKSLFSKVLSYLLLILSFLICISRLVLNVHWLSDILLGFLIAMSIILVALSIYKKRKKKDRN